MSEEREDLIDLDESVEKFWHQYLEEFNEKIYIPILKKHGFTYPEGLQLWFSNKINSNLVDLLNYFEKYQ